MDIDPAALPDDIDGLKDIVRSALAQLDSAKADAAAAQAERSDVTAYIAYLKLQIEKLKRTIYGPRAERTARLLDQMEFELEDLEATATEDEYAPGRKPRRQGRQRLSASSVSAHRAKPSLITCRASGLSCQGQLPANAVAAFGLRSLERR